MNPAPVPRAPTAMWTLRVAVVALACGAALDLAWSPPRGDDVPPLLVLDVSDSVGGAADVRGEPGAERLVFADGVRAVLSGETASGLARDRSRVADAIAAASDRVAGTRRDVLLVTDGRDTEGGSVAAARALGATRHRLFVAPPPTPSADVGLDAVRVVAADPRSGVAVRARVVGNVTGRVRVTLWRAGAAVDARELAVVPDGDVDLDLVDARPLVDATAYEVALEPVDGTPDDDPRDDRLAILARPATPVIVVLDPAAWPATGAGPAFVDGARTDGAFLDGADAIVVADRPWRTLGDAVAARVAELVASGAVLVACGGPASFGAGGWRGTAFERLLPLRCSAPEGGETAVVVAFDRSGSTGEPGPAGTAALPVLVRAIGALLEAAPADVRVGVLPFAARPDAGLLAPGWVRGADAVARRGVVASASALAAGGGTDLDAAIAAAAERVAASGAKRRRVMCLTDGDPDHDLAHDGFPRAREALARANAELSAVVRGDARAAAALRTLATTPEDVALVDDVAAFPEALLAAFHRALARDEVVRAAFAVTPMPDAEGRDALAAVAPTALHRLELSPDARLLATASAPGQPARPFAAVRTLGAGRVVAVAWGGGLEEDAPAARRALALAVRAWAALADRGFAADAANGRLAVLAAPGRGGLEARCGDGPATALVETSPGVYEGEAPRPSEDGAPLAVVGPDGVPRPVRLPVRPPAEARGCGVDEAALRALADAGGGRRLAHGEAPPRAPADERVPLAPFLALAAVVAFLVERALVTRPATP